MCRFTHANLHKSTLSTYMSLLSNCITLLYDTYTSIWRPDDWETFLEKDGRFKTHRHALFPSSRIAQGAASVARGAILPGSAADTTILAFQRSSASALPRLQRLSFSSSAPLCPCLCPGLWFCLWFCLWFIGYTSMGILHQRLRQHLRQHQTHINTTITE